MIIIASLGIERLLNSDPNIEIMPAENWTIPDVNLGLWQKDYQIHRKNFLDYTVEYLNLPYIKDNFIEHGDRKKWLRDMDEKFAGFEDFYNQNALRYNSQYPISLLMPYPDEQYIGTNKDDFLKLNHDLNSLIIPASEYNRLTSSKRLTHVKYTKNKVYDMLEFLAGQEPLV